jgi:hypothetical protein
MLPVNQGSGAEGVPDDFIPTEWITTREAAHRVALNNLFHTLLHHLMTARIRTQGRQDTTIQSG